MINAILAALAITSLACSVAAFLSLCRVIIEWLDTNSDIRDCLNKLIGCTAVLFACLSLACIILHHLEVVTK